MSDTGKTIRGLRAATYYLPKALKFYDLKSEFLTRLMFISTFFSVFIMSNGAARLYEGMLNQSPVSLPDLISGILIPRMVYILSISIYLRSAILEIRGKDANPLEHPQKVFQRLWIIIIASFAYELIFGILLFLMIIPGILFQLIFVFYLPYIVDMGSGFTGSFGASRRLTKGKLWPLFSIGVVFAMAMVFPVLLSGLFSAGTGNLLVASFVGAFLQSIMSLMKQKLVALVYVDLEYGYREPMQ